MRIYVIRHGQTEWNEKKILMGQGNDIPLSKVGIQEIEGLIKDLPKDISKIYHSPLKRASQSAEIINKYIQAPIEKADELVERHFGSLGGREKSDLTDEENDIKIWGEQITHKFDFTKFNGEHYTTLEKRVLALIKKLKDKKEEDVLLVTHAGVIRFLQHLCKKKVESLPKHKHVYTFDI